MMNRLARYAMGSVNFEVTGGRGERFLNDCVNAGVPVEHIRPTQTGYLATVPLRDYKRMHKYARRNRCRLRVREKYGAYFALFTYRHRWGILAGLVLCVLLLCMCRNLIWNICFYNFTPEQEASARAQLFEKGIYEAVSKSYYKLYLPWGELSLYAQLDVPENASQRVLRRPAAPFGFHLPALVEETQVRQAAAVPFDLTPGLAEDIARSRILDAIRAEFGDYELLEETPSAEEADGAVTLTLRVRMLADIGKMVPYEGEAMEPDSTIGADS